MKNLSLKIARLFFIFGCLCCTFSVHALDYLVSGMVLEMGTKKPLEGVFISVDKYPDLSAVSDTKGRFTLALPAPGDYTVQAAGLVAQGFQAINIKISADSPPAAITFYVLSATVLPEVLVQGERSPDRISKSVITGAEVRKIAGSGGDPLVGLQSLPGVFSTNGSSSEPAVRGAGPDENAYYVDGLPIGKLFHFDNISVFNADLIQDFNLYSAAFSPHYADVVGAVLDVALRDPRNDRLGGKVNVNLLGSDFLVEGPRTENQSYYFAARRSYFDLFVKQIKQDGVTLQIPNYWDYQGKYLWKLSTTDRVTLHLQGAADNLKLNVGDDADIAKQQPILSGDLTFNDRYAMQAMVWDAQLPADAYHKLAWQHSNFEFTGQFAGAGRVNIRQKEQQLREKIRLPLNHFGAAHELSLAGIFTHAQTDINVDTQKTTCTQFNPNCDLTSAPRDQLTDTIYANNLEFSAQERVKIIPAVTLVGGVRHSREDYLNRNYTEPRLGAEWEWSPQTLLSAGWGRHNQLPSGQQISKKFGNPTLDHLRAEHSVLGITQKRANDWSWKAETYYKKLSNIIVNDPVLNFINAGSGKAYGAELLIKNDAAENLSGWLALSLARSERRNDVTGETFRFEYDQPVNTTLILNYKESRSWSYGAKWNYHSGAPYTPIFGTSGNFPDGRPIPVYGGVNSAKLPPFHRLDVRIDRHIIFDTWKLNAYFELNNIYQRTNVTGYSYDPTYTSKEAITPFVLPISFGVQGEF